MRPILKRRFGRTGVLVASLSLVATALTTVVGVTPAFATTPTTAWQSGAFHVDTANIVRRSDIVLGQPNLQPRQFMPLGNGSLGASVWGAGGFTAQLNRDDTFPDRKSPGQVTIPGLSTITSAANFTAHLDLYDAILTESGGGMTAQIYLRADADKLVIDVTGANPSSTQTAVGALWAGRSPTAAASGAIGTLAETWLDNGTGGSGQTFGSLLAVTAGGRNVVSSVVNSTSVKVTFNPNTDGSFRVIVGAPHWTGGNAATTASTLFGTDASATSASLQSAHLSWWHNYWTATDLLEMSSTDGNAQYVENLRTIYLYQEASLNRGAYPGSQAGLADLFAYNKDGQDWVPADYWVWNLRMQIAANLSSGATQLNTAFFNLYTSNLTNLQTWTAAHMPGHTGICVPETMRFNGNGYYGGAQAASNASCDSAITPTFNSQTITSGAEISLWMWQQYQATRDLTFLTNAYPFMKAVAQFLLSYATLGTDGLLHTTANAHETQWHVNDPVTDVVAMQALFPAVASAAQTLGTDATFVTQLATAETEVPPLPRTDAATHSSVLTPSSDAGGADVMALSAQPTFTKTNSENLDLEAVWPYGVIGDNSGTLTALADRTYTSRLFPGWGDWNYDSVQAARLDMPSQVEAAILSNVQYFQQYPSGFNTIDGGQGDEPYNEADGVYTTALNEALATDYDGTLRVAPAWPTNWDVSGTVSIQNKSKVDVQVEGGTLVTAVLEAGATASQPVRNPWPGQSTQVVDATTGTTVVAATTASQFTISMTTGHDYLIELSANPFTSLTFAQVTGTPATVAKHLGSVQIGLDAPTATTLAASFNNVGVTADTNTNPGNIDGGGASISAQALATAGVTAGSIVSAGGLSFTWPSTAGGGTADNTLAAGQTIALSGSGSTLGFLVTATYGPASGTGSVIYADGTTQSFTLSSPDWFGGTGTVAITAGHQNRQGNMTYAAAAYIYYVGIPITAGKTLASVRLPNVSATVTAGTPALHVFAIAKA